MFLYTGTWPPPVGVPPSHTGRTLGWGPDPHILPIFDLLGGLEEDRAETKGACHPDLCHYTGRDTEAQQVLFGKDLCQEAEAELTPSRLCVKETDEGSPTPPDLPLCPQCTQHACLLILFCFQAGSLCSPS